MYYLRLDRTGPDSANRVRIPLALPYLYYFHTLSGGYITHRSHECGCFQGFCGHPNTGVQPVIESVLTPEADDPREPPSDIRAGGASSIKLA